MSHENGDTSEGIHNFLRDLFCEVGEQSKLAPEARRALNRLAQISYGHDNSQATIVTRWLASIYSGDDALSISLDEMRRLDWDLRVDLANVLLGVGCGGLRDTEIRTAFEKAAGGPRGAEWITRWTTSEYHRAALARLIEFIQANRDCSSASALHAMLLSILSSRNSAFISQLGFIDDNLTEDMIAVLSALYGRDRTKLYIEDVRQALGDGGLLEQQAY